MSDKTEKPTPKRLLDAAEKGQFPRSRLLSASAVTLAGMVALGLFGANASAQFQKMTVALFTDTQMSASLALSRAVGLWFASLWPVWVTVMLAAVASTLLQVGFVFQPRWLLPKWERVDPVQGLKRLFSARQLVDVFKTMTLAIGILVVAWFLVSEKGVALFSLLRADGEVGGRHILRELKVLAIQLAAVVLGIGIADLIWARWRHLQDLKMSRSEVLREHRQAEGDPHQKAHRQAVARQLAMGGPRRGVLHATALVVNPTHIAVALRYRSEECEAPYLVAKGCDADAVVLREECHAARIPIVRDIPLARSLVHYDVGEAIPEELYEAAAAVLTLAAEKST